MKLHRRHALQAPDVDAVTACSQWDCWLLGRRLVARRLSFDNCVTTSGCITSTSKTS